MGERSRRRVSHRQVRASGPDVGAEEEQQQDDVREDESIHEVGSSVMTSLI